MWFAFEFPTASLAVSFYRRVHDAVLQHRVVETSAPPEEAHEIAAVAHVYGGRAVPARMQESSSP